jgi:pimeloyl-ACP methyl ester carboxylesterase
MMMNKTCSVEKPTPYKLVQSNSGKIHYNWLFFPGGPGISADYLLPLVNQLDIEGNCWLINFLCTHSESRFENTKQTNKIQKNWDESFIEIINQFENPILVGHSFSGYYPLFFPELEHILKGLVILNSAPIPPKSSSIIDIQEFEKLARIYHLPTKNEAIIRFLEAPTSMNIKIVYLSMIPYMFPEEYIMQGIQVINDLVFDAHTAYQWFTENSKKYTKISWIPEKVPTLIAGGTHDFLTPSSLFEHDLRFYRDNIDIVSISNTGHFPWMEQPNFIPKVMKDAFSLLMSKCSNLIEEK